MINCPICLMSEGGHKMDCQNADYVDQEIKALREANQKAKDRCQELIRESDRRLDGVLYIQEALLEKGNE
jgi:hypothetical protein